VFAQSIFAHELAALRPMRENFGKIFRIFVLGGVSAAS
jgi:hypothetical protein